MLLRRNFFLSIFFLVFVSACSSTYYNALESVGIAKRDLMVSRVEKARDSQEEAKQQFQNALERFTALTQFDGGNLEATYKELKAEYDKSVDRAEDVSDRIEDIESVSEALFDEWEEELDQYNSAKLHAASEKKLNSTRAHYNRLINAMKEAESKIDPVLTTFNDQVMFLKHNLNAQAIASLQSELTSMDTDIAALVSSMEASIAEANAFIANMDN